jgi:hypothetical protein
LEKRKLSDAATYNNGVSWTTHFLNKREEPGNEVGIWLPINTENFFRELVDLIRNAEQSRRTHFDAPDFYCRRLEEYECTLSVLTTRITESYTTEQFLINQQSIYIYYVLI